jgi:hypothetical protein
MVLLSPEANAETHRYGTEKEYTQRLSSGRSQVPHALSTNLGEIVSTVDQVSELIVCRDR